MIAYVTISVYQSLLISDKAKQFLDLREELKNIEVGLFAYNIATFKEKLEQLLKDEEIIISQKDSEEEKMQNLQNLKEELRNETDIKRKEEINDIIIKLKRGSEE